MSDKVFLVVGLGNIGPEYVHSRHNIGFMILDAWAQASNIVFSIERYGDLAQIKKKGREFYLLKPSTYMNLSGNAVRYWLQKLDIPLSNLLIISDDLNLPFGTLRIRKSGSDGGHNGLKNIEELLETRDFARLRVGVGNEFERGTQIAYVLGSFSEKEITEIEHLSKKIITGIETWAFCGMEKSMNFLNIRPTNKENIQK